MNALNSLAIRRLCIRSGCAIIKSRQLIFCTLKMDDKAEKEKNRSFFVKIEPENKYFTLITEEIKKRDVVYGDQEQSLKKIKGGKDRSVELLVKEDNPSTLLIYKTELENDLHFEKSFEVKTLLPIDKESVTEDLKKTLDRAVQIAKSKSAKNIHLTVSEREKQTFQFLCNEDFKVRETWNDKYIQGVKEFLMCKELGFKPAKAATDQKAIPTDDSNKRKRTEEESDRPQKSSRKEERGRYDERQRRPNERRIDHVCTLKKKYIHMIRDGLKTVEGRLAVPMFLKWKKGHIIKFHYYNKGDDVLVEITKVTKYKSFRDMLTAEGVTNCIPEINSIDEGVRIYQNIPRYYEKEKMVGVIAFRMKLVN